MIYIALILVAIPIGMFSLGAYLSGPRYRGKRTDHFDGKRFLNPGGVKAKGGMEVFKWMIRRKPGRWPKEVEAPWGKRPLAHYKDGIRITFVNHSTFLIQVAGVNILTDPVWSRRVSPFKSVGPQRVRIPGIRFEDLPRIHAVLLTHNHYDHLDLETMWMVFTAHHPKIIAPLGVKRLLDKHRISGSWEGDWWEDFQLNGEISIRLVPAQHFSGRGLLDRDATLWCGYLIGTPFGNIYFAGDSGYNEEMFREIGSRCDKIKVSLLPIGAYKPGWFMSPIHISPEEAVKIHRNLRSDISIAMHFGTFPLADDGYDDPIRDLRKALTDFQIDQGAFIALKEGDHLVVD